MGGRGSKAGGMRRQASSEASVMSKSCDACHCTLCGKGCQGSGRQSCKGAHVQKGTILLTVATFLGVSLSSSDELRAYASGSGFCFSLALHGTGLSLVGALQPAPVFFFDLMTAFLPFLWPVFEAWFLSAVGDVPALDLSPEAILVPADLSPPLPT